MKKYLFVSIWLCLQWGSQLQAGTTEWVNYLPVDSLYQGRQFGIQDPNRVDEFAAPSNFAVNRTNEIRLIYGREDLTDIDGNDWEFNIIYRVFFTGINSPPITDTLRIAHTPSEHTYEQARVFKPGGHLFTIKIDSVFYTDQSGFQPQPPSDIRLELRIKTERYEKLNPQELPNMVFDPATQRLSWNYIRGAEEYDLEWSWVDAESSGSPNQAFERAVRVNVKGQYYRPDISYRKGVVYFRIRTVGRFIEGVGDDYSHPRYGRWSQPISYVISDPNSFEPEFNWAYTANYAEEGKYKKVIQYADGLGRSRQSLTNLSTDSTTVVTQAEYDHEGRQALTTLPIPFPTQSLQYVDRLNRNVGGNLYTPNDFDTYGTPPPMGDGQGAAKYYSSNNDFFDAIHRDFIPDSKGYPFAQVRYMNDGTGRIEAQGGVGPDHQLGSGHETKFFYGTPSASELHRMFGGNVGNAAHYLKKMSIDPNGQVSYAYQTQEEQVIATCMAGDAPANVVPLDVQSEVLVDNLMAQNSVDTGQGISYAEHIFLNAIRNTNYEFFWDFSGTITEIACICYDCEYTFNLSIVDPDEAVILDTSVVYSASTTCPNIYHIGQFNLVVPFPKLGNYRAIKTLTVTPPDVQALQDSLINCPSFPNIQDYIDDALTEIDSTDCGEDCEAFLPTWFNTDTGPPSMGRDTVAVPCNGAIFLDSMDIINGECSGIYRRMWEDVSPDGWLFDSTAYAATGGDSILIDQLVRAHREWCHYQACLETAPSKLFDIQAASIQTLSEAVRLGFIPDPDSCPLVPSQLNDPYWDGIPGGYAYILDVLCSAPYLNETNSTYFGILNFFSSANPSVDTLYAQCANDPDCIDTLRWVFTRSAYLDAKIGWQMDYLENTLGCPYYDDAYTIVVRPEIPNSAVADPVSWASASLASQCNDNCAGNVDYWMSSLLDSCNSVGVTFPPTDSLALNDALLGFCLGSCQGANPQAILTKDDLSNGALDAVLDILPASCDRFLDSLTVTDPYVYVDPTTGDSLRRECITWDPCLIALIDEINANWSPGAWPGTISLNNKSVLNYCYPTAEEIAIRTDRVELLDANGTVIWQPIALYGNAFINWQEAKKLRALRYGPLLTGPDRQLNGASFEFQQIVLELVSEVNGNQSVQPVELYAEEKPNLNFSMNQDSCIIPNITVDSIWTPNIDSVAAYTECIDNLIEGASWWATQQWETEVEYYLDSIVQELKRRCFSIPYHEKFRVSYTNKTYQYTLYYFDQAGNLVQTVPPEGIDLLDQSTTDKWVQGNANPNTDNPRHRMASRYCYNTLGQPLETESPDGGLSRMWYDDIDRLRLSQDSRQAADNDYAYLKYDALGRTVESGQLEKYPGVIDPDSLNSLVFPDRGLETLSDIVTTQYDNGEDWQENLRTRVAAQIKERLEEDTTSVCRYDYDDHGNVQSLRSELVGLGSFQMEYDYDLISSNVHRVWYQRGEKDYFSHLYRYDADNRLIEVQTTRDDVFYDRDATYYYYPHGPLARVELGEDLVQGTDHYYSIHGWIKGVNTTGNEDRSLDPGQDGHVQPGDRLNKYIGQDAMGYHLGFFEGDYTSIGGNNLGAAQQAWPAMGNEILELPGGKEGLYNGNIALMLTDLELPSTNFGKLHGYAYQYDQLQRIKQGRSYRFVAGDLVRPGNTQGWYDVDYTYDRNGNIENLFRSRPNPNINYISGIMMDILQYRYDSINGYKSNNQLRLVTDGIFNSGYDLDIKSQGGIYLKPFSGRNYTYDEIGNLVADSSEYIDTILWDLSNKVLAVRRNQAGKALGLSDLEFSYDGMGNRISKRVITPQPGGADTIIYWYVRDAAGNPIAVYEQSRSSGGDSLLTWLVERTIYGSQRLGLDRHRILINVEGEESPLGNDNDPNWQQRAFRLFTLIQEPILRATGRFVIPVDLEPLGDDGIVIDFDDPLPIPSPNFEGGRFALDRGPKVYELSNHLGNVLVVVQDYKVRSSVELSSGQEVAFYKPSLESTTDYYPFGMAMPERSYSGGGYRYGFNGMEGDNKILGKSNYWNFGARGLNSVIGRWITIDPITHESESPYVGFNCSPVYKVDLNGEDTWIYSKTGDLLDYRKNNSPNSIVLYDRNIWRQSLKESGGKENISLNTILDQADIVYDIEKLIEFRNNAYAYRLPYQSSEDDTEMNSERGYEQRIVSYVDENGKDPRGFMIEFSGEYIYDHYNFNSRIDNIEGGTFTSSRAVGPYSHKATDFCTSKVTVHTHPPEGSRIKIWYQPNLNYDFFTLTEIVANSSDPSPADWAGAAPNAPYEIIMNENFLLLYGTHGENISSSNPYPERQELYFDLKKYDKFKRYGGDTDILRDK